MTGIDYYTSREAEKWMVDNTEFVTAEVTMMSATSYEMAVTLPGSPERIRAVFYQPEMGDQPDFEVEDF